MPGIFGFLKKENISYNNDVAEKMKEELRHCEEWFDGLYFQHEFGFHGIVDFRNRLQVDYALSNDKKIEVLIFGSPWFSGKNYDISRRDKARIILDIYRKYGLRSLIELDGSFVLSIYDNKRKRFAIMNDRLGSSPIYLLNNTNKIVYSSEIKATLCDPSIKPLLDLEAVTEFFTFSYPLGNKTIFKHISLLPPSSILMYDLEERKVQIWKYWEFESGEKSDQMTLERLIRVFDSIMAKSVQRCMANENKIGVFLSGGLDSRLIAAYAKRISDKTGKKIVSFTFGSKRGGLQNRIATKVADALNIENIFFELSPDWIANYAEEIVYKGDGNLRVRDAHFISYLRRLRDDVGKVLVGFSCDSIFGTHLTDDLLQCSNVSELSDYLFKNFRVTQVAEHIPHIFAKNIKPRIIVARGNLDLWDGLNTEFLRAFPLDRVAHYWELRQRLRRYIFPLTNYISWYLKYADPYLDYEIVRFATNLPFNLKKKKSFLYWVLKYNFPTLAQIEFERADTPLYTLSYKLSAQIRDTVLAFFKKALEKMSFGRILFIPEDYRAYDYWLRTGSRRYIVQYLLLDLNSRFFNRRYVQKIIEDHLSARRNNDQIICDILNFNLFLKKFHVEINEASNNV